MLLHHRRLQARRPPAPTLLQHFHYDAQNPEEAASTISYSLANPPDGATIDIKSGVISWIPPEALLGSEVSFGVVATDLAGNSTTQPVSLLVTTASNQSPIAVNDNYVSYANLSLNISAAEGVLANDTDADGDALTASIISQAAFGDVFSNADGSFIVTPSSLPLDPHFNGDDSFTYEVSDGISSSEATVFLHTVGSPVTENDVFHTQKNTPLTVSASGVLANDFDPTEHAPLHATLFFAMPEYEGNLMRNS